MGDHLSIETPEQISLDLPLAGIGSRFLAVALDTLIQIGVAVAVLMVWLALSALLAGSRSGPNSVWATVLVVVSAFLLEYGYFAFFETIWHGQTPGKRYTHLRVVKSNGQPIGAYESVARNLIRIVDSFPGIYVVGILSALLSSQSKRLGDFVAGTVVIRELPAERPAEGFSQARTAETAGEKSAPALSAYAASLSDEEFQLIEAFLMRRTQLASGVRESIARQIASRIGARLGIPDEDRRQPEDFLEKLAMGYRARVRFRS
jgi:uncharacterized RDD family membrane protein YckC